MLWNLPFFLKESVLVLLWQFPLDRSELCAFVRQLPRDDYGDLLLDLVLQLQILFTALLLLLDLHLFLIHFSINEFGYVWLEEYFFSKGIFGSYISTVFLTLTNPLTIFAFIAVFAALDLGKGLGYYSTSALVIGVFIGSCLWFLSLNSGATFFKKKLNLAGLKWVNRIAGILIILSGVIAIASLL